MTDAPARTVSSADPAGAAGAAPAIVRRALGLTVPERRRLGRWASTAFRDPRISSAISAARNHSQAVLSAAPDRKRRWSKVSGPLYEGLVAAAGEDRRYRLIMLGGHFIAILAVANIPNGLSLPIAALLVLAAPASAWLAWGRATSWLGAIDAALGAELVDMLDDDEIEALQRAWRNSIVEMPPIPPPLIGVVSAFLPSALLIVVLVILVVANLR
jgi:hypothetical protein